jgi:hypothetical protein
MKCQECLYWQQKSEHPRDEGACRRHAPKPRQVDREWSEGVLCRIAWPCTKTSDWCGEFNKKDGGQRPVY